LRSPVDLWKPKSSNSTSALVFAVASRAVAVVEVWEVERGLDTSPWGKGGGYIKEEFLRATMAPLGPTRRLSPGMGFCDCGCTVGCCPCACWRRTLLEEGSSSPATWVNLRCLSWAAVFFSSAFLNRSLISRSSMNACGGGRQVNGEQRGGGDLDELLQGEEEFVRGERGLLAEVSQDALVLRPDDVDGGGDVLQLLLRLSEGGSRRGGRGRRPGSRSQPWTWSCPRHRPWWRWR
jgi:hypothetical protein